VTALALPMRRALTDVTIGRGAIAFWLSAAIVVGALLLARGTSMVAVEHVRIVGLDGHYERRARRALEAEALTMSTLAIDRERLRDSVSEYVDLAGLRTAVDFPHGLTVYVSVRRAVATVRIGGRVLGITAGGAVLESAKDLSSLPRVEVSGGVRDNRLRGAETLAQLTVLGAAPDVLLRRVKSIKRGSRGVVVTLDKGVSLIFGDASQAARKWSSAAAVLADPASKGARYVDLRVADRPALGGLGAAPVTPKQAAEPPVAQTPAQVEERYAAGGGGGPTQAAGTPQQAPATTSPQAQNQVPGAQQGGGVTPQNP
jgi:cell division septal protein FtsQ